jgi:hypothetical protein
MPSNALIRKAVIGVALVLGTAGALPVLAATIGGANVTAKAQVDALNSPDQTVFVDVGVERNMGFLGDHPHVTIDHFNHRAQNEDRPEDSSYSHSWVTLPRIGTNGVDSYEVEDGSPCISCGYIDRACAWLGDRC